MRCPTLAELPSPPPGKTGWPWTVETAQLPDTMPGGAPWPRISIVTPSLNQGQFIEETIRSILLQGYPDLEYVIIDGGSTDGSVDIVRKYEPWLSHWASEKDQGQSHAINKGFARSTGTMLGWLNADDVLSPSSLVTAGAACGGTNEKVMVAGHSEYRDETGEQLLYSIRKVPRDITQVFGYGGGCFFPQPSVFFTRAALADAGELRQDLHYAMDLDLWLRLMCHSRIVVVNQRLSWMRRHENAKTVRNTFRALDEVEYVLRSHSSEVSPATIRWMGLSLRIQRCQTWIEAGFRALERGNRKEAGQTAFRAAMEYPPAVFSRRWIGFVLRIVLPGFLCRILFARPLSSIA